MLTWLARLTFPLAQVNPFDDPPRPAPPPPSHPMSFSDLQAGMRAYNEGATKDNGLRNTILLLLMVIALITLILHLRQKRKNAGPPDNLGKLGRELGRMVHFPMGSRLMLKWVARSSKVPFASLLLSAAMYDQCVEKWATQATFSMARQWGRGRLAQLRPILFDS